MLLQYNLFKHTQCKTQITIKTMDNNHQDFKEVVFKRKPVTSKKKGGLPHIPVSGIKRLETRPQYNNRSAHNQLHNVHKFDNNTGEETKVKHIQNVFSRALQQARLEKKMTQKQLASQINEKPQVINEYESGKAVVNPYIVQKLHRVFPGKLPSNKPNNKQK